MTQPNYAVAYAGLDLNTWFLLLREPRFSVKAAAHIPKLATQRTLNPVNMLWKRAYRHYLKQGRLPLGHRLLAFGLWPMTTSAWRKYCRWFASLTREGVVLLDFEDAEAVTTFLREHGVDLLVVNVWSLLPSAVIAAPAHGAVNVHPSRLPQYRGAVPTLMSLRNQDAESAVSYIVLAAGMDDGGLIGQHRFQIDADDDYRTLEEKVASVTSATLVPDILAYLAGSVRPIQQDHRRASTTPRYNAYRTIDWKTERAIDIYNKANLYPYLEPFDYCYSKVDGRELTFRRLFRTRPPRSRPAPGGFRFRGLRLYVGAADGVLRCTLLRDLPLRDSLYLLTRRYRGHVPRPPMD